MYSVDITDSPVINVSGSRHQLDYAVDGSAMNPLEGFYATLAACAAVYAKKACKQLGVPAEGIHIDCKPFAAPGGALTLARFSTRVEFPGHFDPAQKQAVLEAIEHCAVKEIVARGNGVAFSVVEG